MTATEDRIAMCERQIEILTKLVHMLASKQMTRSEMRILEERASV